MRSKVSLSKFDKIDLVDRDNDVANAKQRANKGVALGLHKHALSRVNKNDRELRIGGAGRHVAGELLVAGRVGHDERAPRRCKKPVGDVDGDALFALGFEAVEQEGKIDVVRRSCPGALNP